MTRTTKFVTVICALKNISINNSLIAEIYRTHHQTLNDIGQDIQHIFKNPITSTVYKQCFWLDLMFLIEFYSLDINPIELMIEINTLLTEVEYYINEVKVESGYLYSIGFESPDSLFLEYCRS